MQQSIFHIQYKLSNLMQIYGLQGSEKIKIFHIVKISPFFFIYHFIYIVSDDRKNLMPTT